MIRSSQPQSTVPPFPSLSERNGDRAPLTPERRERSTHGQSEYGGGTGFGRDIRQYHDNIREERWTHFSPEGVKFPAATVDVIQRGEALAIFERDLIFHFQQMSKASALYIKALLGGVNELLKCTAGWITPPVPLHGLS